MSRIHGIRKALFAGCALFGFTSLTIAQTPPPATGLGQAWPNAADVSANPHWHVYVFYLNGVKYVQVNDLGGNVHAAIGTAGGTAVVLPVGVDAQNVTTSAPVAATSTVTVYNDGTTAVTATPQSNGTTLFSATPVTNQVCQGGYNCGGGRGG